MTLGTGPRISSFQWYLYFLCFGSSFIGAVISIRDMNKVYKTRASKKITGLNEEKVVELGCWEGQRARIQRETCEQRQIKRRQQEATEQWNTRLNWSINNIRARWAGLQSTLLPLRRFYFCRIVFADITATATSGSNSNNFVWSSQYFCNDIFLWLHCFCLFYLNEKTDVSF